MIGTNRDLQQIRNVLDQEISRLQELAAATIAPGWVQRRLALSYRQRLSICAALVNRRAEAANKVVVFSRWVSGGGALDSTTGRPIAALPKAPRQPLFLP